MTDKAKLKAMITETKKDNPTTYYEVLKPFFMSLLNECAWESVVSHLHSSVEAGDLKAVKASLKQLAQWHKDLCKETGIKSKLETTMKRRVRRAIAKNTKKEVVWLDALYKL